MIREGEAPASRELRRLVFLCARLGRSLSPDYRFWRTRRHLVLPETPTIVLPTEKEVRSSF